MQALLILQCTPLVVGTREGISLCEHVTCEQKPSPDRRCPPPTVDHHPFSALEWTLLAEKDTDATK